MNEKTLGAFSSDNNNNNNNNNNRLLDMDAEEKTLNFFNISINR